jgi:uncharacterized membrane protein YgaE (UPF0421/DUF939 family)
MEQSRSWSVPQLNRQSLEHSTRTAVAAVASILVARAIRLPEYYWAPITTLVVMQSTLGAALTVSGQRVAGTALGAAAGALLAPRFGSDVVVFGAAVLVLGMVCAMLQVGSSAYRFSGITLAIVMLIPRDHPAWLVATHRFVEVSMGVAVGLLVTAIWPERGRAAEQKESGS